MLCPNCKSKINKKECPHCNGSGQIKFMENCPHCFNGESNQYICECSFMVYTEQELIKENINLLISKIYTEQKSMKKNTDLFALRIEKIEQELKKIEQELNYVLHQN